MPRKMLTDHKHTTVHSVSKESEGLRYIDEALEEVFRVMHM